MKKVVYLLIVIIISVTLGCTNTASNYEKKLEDFSSNVGIARAHLAIISGLYRQVWYDAAVNGSAIVNNVEFTNFEEAVYAQELFFIDLKSFESLEQELDTVGDSLKELRNPPSQYEEAYDECVKITSILLRYRDACKDYIGHSLKSYTETVTGIDDELQTSLNMLEVYIMK